MLSAEVVVVGAGPAGLSAACAAREAGAQVMVLDDQASPGGQLFKQIHKFFGSKAHLAGTRGFEIGQQLLDRAREAGVDVLLNASVAGSVFLFEAAAQRDLPERGPSAGEGRAESSDEAAASRPAGAPAFPEPESAEMVPAATDEAAAGSVEAVTESALEADDLLPEAPPPPGADRT